MINRREFLYSLGALLAGSELSAECNPNPFNPLKWLRLRNQGLLQTHTPQSGRDLIGLQSRTLDEWLQERLLYERAFRELIGPWPATRPPLDPQIHETFETQRWIRYKVSYRTLSSTASYASRILAWLFIPKNREFPRPAIVTLHQTVSQGKDEPAGIKATLPWMAFATEYASRGYVTLAPDSIGFGERTRGCYGETGYELPDALPILKTRRLMTLLGLMLFDCTRAVDFLVSRSEVDASRIGVIGHSLGGILTNMVLPLEPRLHVGVASCGYGIFRTDRYFDQRWAFSQSAYLPRMALYTENRQDLPLDFLQILALSAPRPYLLQTAMGDSIWSPEAVQHDPFIAGELRRIRAFYENGAETNFVHIQPHNGSLESDHGWYPQGQIAARKLFAKTLMP